jgi:CubicO group peptidase (beta-lactamase class C family)
VIFEPGTGWAYGVSVSIVFSNSSIENRNQQGFDAAGILIERVTGVKLHEYFQEHILKPLGIENLGFWPNQAMMDNLAKMHLRQPNGEIMEIPHTETSVNSPLGTNGFCNGGGGCFGSLQGYSSKFP